MTKKISALRAVGAIVVFADLGVFDGGKLGADSTRCRLGLGCLGQAEGIAGTVG